MSMAVYAGTFDPVTLGHVSVLRQAVRLFSHIVVLVAHNPRKKTLFSVEERVELLRDAVSRHPNVSVAFTEGLVVDYARDIGANVLLRGIRGGTDADFESHLADENRALAPEIATILLPAAAALAEVSSSRLKTLIAAGDDVTTLCSTLVATRLRARLAELAS